MVIDRHASWQAHLPVANRAGHKHAVCQLNADFGSTCTCSEKMSAADWWLSTNQCCRSSHIEFVNGRLNRRAPTTLASRQLLISCTSIIMINPGLGLPWRVWHWHCVAAAVPEHQSHTAGAYPHRCWPQSGSSGGPVCSVIPAKVATIVRRENKKTDYRTPFGINLMKSQVLYWAAQGTQ